MSIDSVPLLRSTLRSDRERLWRKLQSLKLTQEQFAALMRPSADPVVDEATSPPANPLMRPSADPAVDEATSPPANPRVIDSLPNPLPVASGPLASWLAEVAASRQQAEHRERVELHIDYDLTLPICNHREDIIAAIQNNQVIIVCGETGSGKSTQLPKFCWQAGLGRGGYIGHTQPRRIAARSIATRIASELETKLGETVGYKMRFTDRVQSTTLIKLMTDGILLSEVQHSRELDAYDCLIIDEAHERSINIDLILAYVKRMLPRRPEFRLIITSATIDAEKFADYFSLDDVPAPVFLVSGRTFPVEIRYRPIAENAYAFTDAIDELRQDSYGDVLVFLPTERDIRFAERTLRGHLTSQNRLSQVDVLPLYSRLNEADQQRIFAPAKRQRIILSTNVAESSLTVPSVRYVIDFGTARMARYAPRSKVQRLPIEPISQASANQRAGRCGRIADGICIRLFSEEDFAGRSAFTTPEIRRANLASVMLQVKLAGIDNLESLDWIEPPLPESIRDARSTLRELDGLDANDRLTATGRKLGRWPVDPRIAKILLLAADNNCLADCLILASALEIQDPRLRPVEQQQAADKAHEKFLYQHSDFGSILLLWDFYHRMKAEVSRSRLDKVCRDNFLSAARFREWLDVHKQLLRLTQSQNISIGERRWLPATDAPQTAKEAAAENNANKQNVAAEVLQDENYAAVHRSLLGGLLSGLAMRRDDGRYVAVGQMEVQIWPGSSLKKSQPAWLVAAEIVETTQRYVRNVARIDNEWTASLAAHMLKHSYEQPHFAAKTSQAMVYRKSTLFGLPVLPRTRVPLAPIDPAAARDLLIDEGIVQQQMQSRAKFLQHNQKLLQELDEYANRTRVRSLVIDHYFLEQFYHSRIPVEIVDRKSLEAWDREVAGTLPPDRSPFLQWQDLLGDVNPDTIVETFPDSINIGTATVPITYSFAPGTETDGVTALVPATAIGQISEDRIGWLVPGLLQDRILGLIKSLPKRLRRNLSPAPDNAVLVTKRMLEKYSSGGAFWPTLCQIVSEISGERIVKADFEPSKLQPHLNMQLAVIDEAGTVQTLARDVEQLRQQIGVTTATTQEAFDPNWLQSQAWYKQNLKTFAIEALPKEVQVQVGGVLQTRYPSLVDNGESVDVALLDHPELATKQLQRGSGRLLSLALNRELRSQLRHLPDMQNATMRLQRRLPAAMLESALISLMVRIGLLDRQPPIRSNDDFEVRQIGSTAKVSMAAAELGRWLPKLAQAYQAVALAIESTKLNNDLRQEIEEQLKLLFIPDFWHWYDWSMIKEYPRFLSAIEVRLKRLAGGGQTADSNAREVLRPYEKFLADRLNNAVVVASDQPLQRIDGVPMNELSQYVWMLEELRVSIHAQQLGTSMKISPKRLDQFKSRLIN